MLALGGNVKVSPLTGSTYAALRNGFQVYMFANRISLLELTDHADPFERAEATENNAIHRFSESGNSHPGGLLVPAKPSNELNPFRTGS